MSFVDLPWSLPSISFLSDKASSDSKLRRERTYEDVGDFMQKLEIEEGDEGTIYLIVVIYRNESLNISFKNLNRDLRL